MAEPNNKTRSDRIKEILGASWEYEDVVDLLTDLRHFCEEQELDFYVALGTSYLHYLEERAG